MKTETEKEKKLSFAINKLKNLKLQNPSLKTNLENLNAQKNQLEIEKKEIEEKLGQLSTEFEEITMLGLDLEMLQDQMDEKEIRWLELEELKSSK